MRTLLVLLAAAAVLVPAAPAAAGSYTVAGCASGVGAAGWTFARVKGVFVDDRCGSSATDSIGLYARESHLIDGGTAAAMTFTAPAGTTITDFRFERRVVLRGAPPQGSHRPYVLYQVGPTAFAGGGTCCSARRSELDAQGQWLDSDRRDIENVQARRKAGFPALATYNGGQTQLQLKLGCFAGGAQCRIPAGGFAETALSNIRMTLGEDSKPALEVLDEGLFAPGGRNAADPIVVNASDPRGIRAVELFLTADRSFPVAAEYYATDDVLGVVGGTNDAGATCSFASLTPCPNLARETFRSAGDLSVGKQEVVVRVTDAAGNATESAPRTIDVKTDADRGAPNGAPASDAASLVVAKPVVRAGVGATVTIAGALRTAAGGPIAGAAIGVSGAGSVVTAADGTWSATVKAVRSRTIGATYRAFEFDERPTARAAVQLQVPVGASIKAPRAVAAGARFTVRGRIRGLKPTRKALLLVAQVRDGKRWKTLGRARTKKQSFRVGARIGRRGTRDVRVRLLSRGRYPYEDGATRVVKVKVR